MKKKRYCSAYIGQNLFDIPSTERKKGRPDFGWRLGHAIDVLLGKCDVIVWEKWGDTKFLK